MMARLPVALQLYTVRDETARDFAGTVKQVAEIGYAGVEIAGRGSLSVHDLRTLLDDNNLRICGSHISMDALEKGIGQVIEENLALGNRYVVVSYLEESRRQDAAGYEQTAEALNGFGETLRSYGLVLAYHNHDFEFAPQENGRFGLEILLERTDHALVKFELDAYWALVAGQDPVAFIQKHSGRMPLLHVKDRDTSDGSFAEVGTGDLPLDALISAAQDVGVEWLIVEQDTCKRPPLESVKISLDNLKARGYA